MHSRQTHQSLQDVEILWRAYEGLQVFHSVAAQYTRFFLLSTFVGVATTIIVCFYVSIRDSELPLIIYILFLIAGVTMFFWLFWYAYQVVMMVRVAEEIVGIFTAAPYKHYKELLREEKKYLMRKGRATRPLGYRMGNFADFSLDVPVATWEEIVNQLLFLLSL